MSTPPLCARRAIVTGLVQGVGFRWHTRALARELGLGGWVQNLADGSVEVYVEGPPTSVESLLTWLHHGPAGARVDAVRTWDAAAEIGDGSEFRVRR